MTPEDLSELGGLITTVVTQRQVVPFNAGISLLKWHLEMMFGTINESSLEKVGKSGEKGTVLRVFDTIDIKQLEGRNNQLTLEWIGNAMNDMIADSVLAVILSVDSSPASVKGKKDGKREMIGALNISFWIISLIYIIYMYAVFSKYTPLFT